MPSWLGVVAQDHVTRAVALGFAQVSHGKRGPLARMRAGDRLLYYSSRTSMRAGAPLRAFTACAVLPDDEIWQADEGTFQPWRRRAAYAAGTEPVGLEQLRGSLELTADPAWGQQLRRGLVALSEHDADLVISAMGGPRRIA